MNNKEEFLKILRSVDRPGIEELIGWLESTSFFEDPASSRFHGNWKGGLCDHSLQVYKEFVSLTNRDDDTVKVACLLHDVCKIGNYNIVTKNVKNKETGKWEEVEAYEGIDDGFPFGHGEKSVMYLVPFISLSVEELLMIRWHMGPYEGEKKWRDLELAQQKYISVLYIHVADCLATRKNI